jgi:tetratricopeptide (TPR) repeat protein/predicted aspartyl protease
MAVAPVFAMADCQIIKIAELPVTMSGLRPLVPAKINGSDALFVADSGAFYSLITAAGAAQYQLKLHHAPYALRLEGVGGTVVDPSTATVEKLTLADQTVSNIEFIVAGSEPGTGAVGLLGQNLLGLADTEYDLARGVIRLMRPGPGCKKTVLAYWVASSQPYSVIDLDWTSGKTSPNLGVASVNGVRIQVMFDTGAGSSFLTRRAAERAGFTPAGQGVVPAGLGHGIGTQNYQTWIAPFASFKIGDEEIHDTRLRVGDASLPEADMLLGADFFLSHHIYIAKSRSKLYFTYNGGPVFNLTQPANNALGAEPAPVDDQAEPTDAPSFARRGAAYAARHDFEHAIADLTRACELDPANATYFRQRGLARLGTSQPSLAMADFDEALKLKPDDIEALIWRAKMRLGVHDIAGASADLQAADRSTPKEANVRLQIAGIYVLADRLTEALAQYDLWIAAHPEDADLANAKNGRCWVRALLGIDLDKALKDCNDAVRAISKSAEFLDARALVRLRRGEYDESIADYDASLSLNPRNAWSLYGRGVDRVRKGMAAEGDADIAAATAIWPTIAQEAKRHGIAP